MPRVLVTPAILYGVAGPYLELLQQAGFEVIHKEPAHDLNTPEELIPALAGIDAVIASMEPFTDEVLAATSLRVIARMGVGYDAIDVDAADRHGVVVTITPGTNEHSVAEQAIALLIGAYRGVAARDQEVRSGVWHRRSLPRLAGRTIGLVGLGRIGRAVVPRAQGLGLNVIAFDPVADREWAENNGVELTAFDDLLATADVVSLHLPCTPETTDLINADTLAKMKPGAILINTSRGGLVDEDALCHALESGHLFAAGLDVFKIEPLPTDSPLLQFDNVLLAPHMGGLDHQSEIDMSRLAAQCIADLHAGQWPAECIVNRALDASWKW